VKGDDGFDKAIPKDALLVALEVDGGGDRRRRGEREEQAAFADVRRVDAAQLVDVGERHVDLQTRRDALVAAPIVAAAALQAILELLLADLLNLPLLTLHGTSVAADDTQVRPAARVCNALSRAIASASAAGGGVPSAE